MYINNLYTKQICIYRLLPIITNEMCQWFSDIFTHLRYAVLQKVYCTNIPQIITKPRYKPVWTYSASQCCWCFATVSGLQWCNVVSFDLLSTAQDCEMPLHLQNRSSFAIPDEATHWDTEKPHFFFTSKHVSFNIFLKSIEQSALDSVLSNLCKDTVSASVNHIIL